MRPHVSGTERVGFSKQDARGNLVVASQTLGKVTAVNVRWTEHDSYLSFSQKSSSWHFCRNYYYHGELYGVSILFIEGARYVMFGEPILLTNKLGVHWSQNYFVSVGRKGLTVFFVVYETEKASSISMWRYNVLVLTPWWVVILNPAPSIFLAFFHESCQFLGLGIPQHWCKGEHDTHHSWQAWCQSSWHVSPCCFRKHIGCSKSCRDDPSCNPIRWWIIPQMIELPVTVSYFLPCCWQSDDCIMKGQGQNNKGNRKRREAKIV